MVLNPDDAPPGAVGRDGAPAPLGKFPARPRAPRLLAPWEAGEARRVCYCYDLTSLISPLTTARTCSAPAAPSPRATAALDAARHALFGAPPGPSIPPRPCCPQPPRNRSVGCRPPRAFRRTTGPLDPAPPLLPPAPAQPQRWMPPATRFSAHHRAPRSRSAPAAPSPRATAALDAARHALFGAPPGPSIPPHPHFHQHPRDRSACCHVPPRRFWRRLSVGGHRTMHAARVLAPTGSPRSRPTPTSTSTRATAAHAATYPHDAFGGGCLSVGTARCTQRAFWRLPAPRALAPPPLPPAPAQPQRMLPRTPTTLLAAVVCRWAPHDARSARFGAYRLPALPPHPHFHQHPRDRSACCSAFPRLFRWRLRIH
ncbi:hypothetical protein DFH06DRAFT_1334886 [Mycena polygramma]|nr:hypothetical protein DFH06DRAFT_1334886 [Mycena polygramma]